MSAIDRLLPREVMSTHDDVRRGRLFLAITAALSVAAFFFASESAAQGQAFVGNVSAILFAGGLISLLNVPLVWLVRGVRIPAAVACIELIGVVFSAGWFGGGIGDPSQWFLLIAPLLATFLIGPRAGFVAAALGGAGVTALFVARESGAVFLPPAPEDPRFHALGSTIVLFTVAGFSALYEASRVRSLALVEKAMSELREKHSELEGLAAKIAEARDRALAESSRKTDFLTRMREFSEAQALALERTRASTQQLSETLKAISTSVETLATASRSSDASISSMADRAGRASETAHGVVAGVEDTNRALQPLTAAVAAVQAHVDALRSQADTTAGAMLEMETWSSTVEENAARTVALSDAMIRDAERGHEAVRRTLAGVDGIRASARLAGEVIRTLESRVSAIGAMNNVIDEVAVETNVLALNASIIAAQAGERGHGFAIVAEQIKSLAARTADSTKEISTVVRSVQDEARNAVTAIGRGESAVEAGVVLSEEASRALELIVASAREATEEVRGIEQATVAQAKRARDVGQAMSEVTRLLAAAVRATQEHGEAVRLIEDAMARLRAVAPNLEERSRQQADSARQARSAISRINEMASRLSTVQGEQSRASEQTLRAVEEIQRAQRGQAEALAALSDGRTDGRTSGRGHSA